MSQSNSLINSIFPLYGLTPHINNYNNVITGYIITTHMGVILQSILSLNSIENSIDLIFKTLHLLVFVSSLISYAFVKINSHKIIEINDEFNKYYLKYKITNNNASLLIYFILHPAHFIIGLVIMYFSDVFDKLTIGYFINLKYKHHAPFSIFYVCGLISFMPLLYLDVNAKYINILRAMYIKMTKLQTYPAHDHLYEILSTIKKFPIDNFVLNKYVFKLKYFVVFNICSIILMEMIIIWHLLNIYNNTMSWMIYLVLLLVVLTIMYTLYVINIIRQKRQIIRQIITRLTEWKCIINYKAI